MSKSFKATSLALTLAAVMGTAQAAAPVQIGFVTTLSTPAGYIGEDLRDGFELVMKQNDGKLGGVPVQLRIEDDALKPANAKQAVDRLIQSGVKLFTGSNFSNVLAAEVPSVIKSGGFFISPNAGPSIFAGKKCMPNYFVASFQNDAYYHATGVAANELGFKRVVALAPDYQAGRDAIAGFKKRYKGEVIAEIYNTLDQSDFSVEIARIRSLAPDAVYEFEPGGAGINFSKQYAAAGLNKKIPLLMPNFSMDAHMMAATGGAAEGAYVTGSWSETLDTPVSKKFVQDFKTAYGRIPTIYAMQAYDTAQLIASGLKAVDGDLSKAAEFRAALRKADFPSVRGNFKFNTNQHPIQDYYLMRVEKNASGELEPKVLRKILTNDGDDFAKDCKMPS